MRLSIEGPGTRDAKDAAAQHERRLNQLIDWLPKSWRSTARWLRQPAQRWLRIGVAVLLIVGSLLSILPLFGLWMLPLGLVLLAEDVPVLRAGRRSHSGVDRTATTSLVPARELVREVNPNVRGEHELRSDGYW